MKITIDASEHTLTEIAFIIETAASNKLYSSKDVRALTKISKKIRNRLFKTQSIAITGHLIGIQNKQI